MGLFLYGTLRQRELLTLVAGEDVAPIPAILPGHAVLEAEEAHAPVLIAREGGRAEGLYLPDPSEEAQARLDCWELPFGYERRTFQVETPHGPREAEVYWLTDTPPLSGTPWSLGRWEEAELPLTLLAAREFDLSFGTIGPEVIARNWHMILHRASARLRAGTIDAPARLRHQPGPGEFETVAEQGLWGHFFRHRAVRLRHRTFDGTMSPPLEREALIGADAALVLPYDAARDRVLLIEQFRTGPFLHGNPNPWMLEPVAGIVDAGETPEEAAHRECGEEAGITLNSLTRMFAIYASPGSTTDHFHCYMGAADLPDTLARRGGLASEHEDLRIHLVPLDEALGLIDTGEASVGPLVAMLLWLDRHRRSGA